MSRSLYASLSRRFGRSTSGVSRRELIKGALAASAGILISGCRSGGGGGGLFSSRVDKRVSVVGAGFGGLACAHELKSAGYDVTVFEARPRIGGRVVSYRTFLPGKVIEGGGEFVGSNHPTWLGYAERFELGFLDVTEEDAPSPVVIDGRHLGHAEVERLWEEMEAAYATLLAEARTVNEDEPWKSPDAAALDRRSVAEWLSTIDASPTCKRAISAELGANNGVAVEDQSYLGNLAQIKGGGMERYWEESEALRCKGGNQQLAAKLAKAIGEDNLKLRTPVVSVQQKGKLLLITTADGHTYGADDVVLAVAPSVWGKMQIYPPLPPALRPQMGVAVKHISALRVPCWRQVGLSPDAFTDDAVSMTWNATDGQGDAPVALTAFSGGPAALEVQRYRPDERDGEYLKRLEAMYPKLGEFRSGTRFMNWPRDPWTMAGYSFPAPGQVTAQGPLLRKGHGNVHFAGEYACYKFVGYMEGALNSGATLARRLAKRDGVLKA
jgi:monoamine oxidase